MAEVHQNADINTHVKDNETVFRRKKTTHEIPSLVATSLCIQMPSMTERFPFTQYTGRGRGGLFWEAVDRASTLMLFAEHGSDIEPGSVLFLWIRVQFRLVLRVGFLNMGSGGTCPAETSAPPFFRREMMVV